ncbi:hypothetical protein HN789_02060 [archaeon]|nr:hypothetical protein [archaeon]MBT4021846.1 hypothetical protein [archaeon]MBT4272141.1 hypothetical protein [archaeon]MBT4460322.1 hypothetical protein [archaeon]MBT4858946.1 hypothetical protein [archaeon]
MSNNSNKLKTNKDSKIKENFNSDVFENIERLDSHAKWSKGVDSKIENYKKFAKWFGIVFTVLFLIVLILFLIGKS